jgi:hypothetical protein
MVQVGHAVVRLRDQSTDFLFFRLIGDLTASSIPCVWHGFRSLYGGHE